MGFKAIVIKAGIFSSIFSSMLVSHQGGSAGTCSHIPISRKENIQSGLDNRSSY
jgi:hypothetical protein